MMDYNKELLFDKYMHELKSPLIDKYKRAEIIKEYLTYNDLSIRGFAQKFDIPKSTVDDWMLPLRLSEDKYKQLSNDFSKKEVYSLLRKDKTKDISNINNSYVKLKTMISFIKKSAYKDFNYDKDFLDLIDELKKSINYFEFRVKNKEDRTNDK